MTHLSLTSMMPSFTDELLKEAGFRDLVAKMPHLVKALPAKSKKIVDGANLRMAQLGTKYPKLYQELNDPSNYAGAGVAIKKLLDG